MTYAHTIAALADPTRRAIWQRLRKRELSVGDVARAARISQPAASQHLRVLREARLVRHRSEGTRRYYAASTQGLAELRRWVESMWDDVLSAYGEGDT